MSDELIPSQAELLAEIPVSDGARAIIERAVKMLRAEIKSGRFMPVAVSLGHEINFDHLREAAVRLSQKYGVQTKEGGSRGCAKAWYLVVTLTGSVEVNQRQLQEASST